MKSQCQLSHYIHWITLTITLFSFILDVKAQEFVQKSQIEVKELELLPGILSPKRWYKKDSTQIITYHGVVDKGEISFNLVDGFSIWQSLTSKWIINDKGLFEVHGSIAYDLTTKEILGRLHLAYTKNHINYWFLNFQNLTKDFKGGKGESEMLDLFAILFAKRNYKKYYRSQNITLSWRNLNTDSRWEIGYDLQFERALPLENVTDFTFNTKTEKNFETNDPINPLLSPSQLEKKILWTQSTKVRFFLDERRSSFIQTNYTLGTENDQQKWFQKLGLTYHGTTLGNTHRLQWTLNTGTFLGTDPFHFSQFHHYTSTSSDVTTKDLSDEWFLSNDYEMGTSESWLDLKLAFKSRRLLLTQLEFFHQMTAYESIYCKTQFNKDLPQRIEAGYTLHKLFESFSFGVTYSYAKYAPTTYGLYLSLPFMENTSQKRYFHKW
ncbi:DUF5686 family protein [Prolixibacteraceae bacterium]|nr:DUF5686 family protein [Prolixibacteraceae bacterium]